MSHYLPVRQSGHVRRRRPVRRASRRISRVQMTAIAAMAACLALAGLLVVAPPFKLRTLDLQGARFTARQAVESVSRVGEAGTANSFSFRSDDVVSQLVRLPAVEEAKVEVALPDTLVVTLTERTPKLVWMVNGERFAVDSTGLLFGRVDAAGRPIPSTAGPLPVTPQITPEPSPTDVPVPTEAATATPAATSSAAPKGSVAPKGSASPSASALAPPSLDPLPQLSEPAPVSDGGLSLPVVIDRRAADAGLKIGDYLDPVVADAAFRVGSLTPEEIGSTAGRLVVVVDDLYGVTLTPATGGWVACFGFYTSRRPPQSVPTQVRDLHAVFERTPEAKVAWVWLLGDLPGGQIVVVQH